MSLFGCLAGSDAKLKKRSRYRPCAGVCICEIASRPNTLGEKLGAHDASQKPAKAVLFVCG